MQGALHRSRPDVVILLTSEHWSNFFLDHIGAFCIGRAEHFDGPVEPWLKVPKSRVPGHPDFAAELIDALYAADFEPSFSHSMALDHGSMVPLHFLTPEMKTPVVPIMFNTLAVAAAERAALSRIRARDRAFRGALQAARRAGRDRRAVARSRASAITASSIRHSTGSSWTRWRPARSTSSPRYTTGDLMSKGAGTMELLSWVALAGATEGRKGEILAYEAVKPWGTGIGLIRFR